MTTPPELSRQTQTLDALLDRVQELARRGARPVVVFDLDDTLFSTARRHIRIIREFCSSSGFRARHPEDAFRLAQLEPGQLCYSPRETAVKAGISDEKLLREFKSYWSARFFTNDYVRLDEPLPGAVEYCREVRARGGIVVYLTGRDSSVGEGTLDALKARGFPTPQADGAVLILKPRFDLPDLDYKREAAAGLAALGEVAGGFENEPCHVELFQDAFPEARMVLIETRHSGKSGPARPDIPRIKNFERG